MAGRNALIIEDNLEIADIYAITIEFSGYDVEIIPDGRVALTRLEAITPDLIILDMNLPGVSGHYIYKHLRSDARFDQTRIIISTANSLVAGMLGQELDPSDYILLKPVGPNDLAALVESL